MKAPSLVVNAVVLGLTLACLIGAIANGGDVTAWVSASAGWSAALLYKAEKR